MKRINKSVYGSELGISTQEFSVNSYTRSSQVYNIFLQDVITSSEDFQSALTVLSVAGEDDDVNIFLSSPGGSIDAGMTLISEMRQCNAKIHVKASGTCASMAVFILLACDSFQLDSYTNLMIHSASFGHQGPVQDVVEYTRFVQKQTTKMFREFFEGFLTEEEILDVLINKKEMWMDAEEFCKRFEARQEYLEALDEEAPEASLEDMSEEDLQGLLEAVQAKLEQFDESTEEDIPDTK